MQSVNAYRVKKPDYELSPHTGMNRHHWIENGKYVLDRAFSHVESFNDLLVFPTVPGSKTYPQSDDPQWRYRSLEFEGLRRTTTIAAPLMHVEPDVAIRGYRLRDYYCHHFHKALTPGNPSSIPMPEDLPDATYQFTCELGGLAVFLLRFPDVIWPYYTTRQQDDIAQSISKWAHHRTTQNNWRFFNICMLSFLKLNGYPIDEELLKSHLSWIASYYAGQGWYLEQNYNYYTISMYSLYQTIWNRAYGDAYEPDVAAIYERNVRELMRSFPFLFARNGFITMWARSIVYRLWVAGGFPVAFMLREKPPIDPGWARRLASGALLQFTTREDFYQNDVPALGFYGHREYMLQGYSCAASPFTMFMPFLSLSLPSDSPFWTAKETDGPWEQWGDECHVYNLDNAGMNLVNHGKTGTTEIVPAKVNEEDHNYNRLCYNSHFPWEAHDPDGGTAMEYCFRSMDPRDIASGDTLFYLGLAEEKTDQGIDRSTFNTPKAVLYNGYRDGVLYRQVLMKRPPNNGSGYTIDLAEIALPNGVLRVDRCRLAFEHELTLGHFGVPHISDNPPAVRRRSIGAWSCVEAVGIDRSAALCTFNGWDALDTKTNRGHNAEAEVSTVVFARRRRMTKNPPMELMISLLLHKTEGSIWQETELHVVRSIEIQQFMPSGSPLGANIQLADGNRYTVDFNEIDGTRRN